MPLLTERATAAAFAPGHVTGFFEIHDQDPDPAKKGSRGAGFSVALGARAYVEVEPAEAQEVRVQLNRAPDPAPVTARAVALVLQEAAAQGRLGYDRAAPKGERAKARVVVHAELDLPVGAGFGMSAAGALSTAFATARALGLGRSDAARAAHVAEVEQRTGLGDVVGALHGGFEIRRRPGLPPWGDLRSFVGYEEVVLAVVEGPLETRAVLRDRAARARINTAGRRAVDAMLDAPTLEAFVALGGRFAEESGLLTDRLRDAIEAARPYGHAGMVMLGNSVYAFGRTGEIEDALREFGETYVCRIDVAGARFLEVERAGR